MALKEFVGVVVSNKMAKTRIVSVDERVYHKTYKKVITKTKRYAAQDIEFNAALGDVVKIRQTPILPSIRRDSYRCISRFP